MNKTSEVKTELEAKQYLLKGLDYLYKLAPSKMDMYIFARFKRNLLPALHSFISAADEQKIFVKIDKVLGKQDDKNNIHTDVPPSTEQTAGEEQDASKQTEITF